MDPLPIALAVILVVLGVWALAVIVLWRAAPAKTTLLDAVRLLPDVLRLAAGLARDPTTPRSCRLALAGLALWIASPIDQIPEFIPVLGPVDDIVVAAIVLRWVGRRIGEDALRAHWPGTTEGFSLVLRLLGRPVA